MKQFSTLNLSKTMLENIESLNYKYTTDIQEKAIPEILMGRDILAMAKTGSGKTAAFGIGILENLDVSLFRVQSLILCPTRELAEQVTNELRKIAKFKHNIKIAKLIGGLPMYKQEHSLRHLAHIVVGTPGRVQKLLDRGSLDLKELKSFVLDEADRMLDMGFIDQIEDIFRYTPKETQVLCFSATFSEPIKKLSMNFLNKPAIIEVEKTHETTVIDQFFYNVENDTKESSIVTLLNYFKPKSTIIFCNTKDVCRNVQKILLKNGIQSLALHGDLEQKERTETLVQFSNGSCRVLVATDVAARGLDIKNLEAVINFDLPFETETYIHRIGRTGRAGEKGLSLSLLTQKEDFRLNQINSYFGTNIQNSNIPELVDISSYPQPDNITVSINGGRRTKVSAGDILGVLTSNPGIKGNLIGKIDRLDYITFIAVNREIKNEVVKTLEMSPIKGKIYRVISHNI
ncbi:MAG: ATP-dependent RNA helicase DbpA [Spirochaetales bacterium]|nr:ATP-dependent RNA helicase DbpA [Spirochaetales bacterium]